MKLEINAGLSVDTVIYRFISLETVLSFVESSETYVSRVQAWDDQWEAMLLKVPTVDHKGREVETINVLYMELFGQCWTLLPESDALWRIYSTQKTGLAISSTVGKLKLIQGMERCFVGRVVYFDGIPDLLEKAKNLSSSVHAAFLKRSAFKHEEEVRLIAHLNDLSVDYKFDGMRVNLKLDPLRFVDSVTIDPRADDWFVATIKRYCKRVGFRFEPRKSSLYEPDPHLKSGIVTRYEVVGGKK